MVLPSFSYPMSTPEITYSKPHYIAKSFSYQWGCFSRATPYLTDR